MSLSTPPCLVLHSGFEKQEHFGFSEVIPKRIGNKYSVETFMKIDNVNSPLLLVVPGKIINMLMFRFFATTRKKKRISALSSLVSAIGE